MIGPGWMPSRPRPLVRVRRVFAFYPSYYARRRRPRRTRAETRIEWPLPPASFDAGGDGTPAGLPIATLHAVANQPRHRLLLGDFQRWLSDRWVWLRPRSIPLLVACAALPAMLAFADALKHPVDQPDDLRLRVRIDVSGTPGHVAVSEVESGLWHANAVLIGPPSSSLCVSTMASPVSSHDLPASFAICPSR